MSMKLNKAAYESLIEEDIKWLEGQPDTLERHHIIDIVRASIQHYYPRNTREDSQEEQPDYKQLQKIINLLPHINASDLGYEDAAYCGGANEKCPKCLLQAYITQRPDSQPSGEFVKRAKEMVCPSCIQGCTKEACLFYKLFAIIDRLERDKKCLLDYAVEAIRWEEEISQLQALLTERDAEIERLKEILHFGNQDRTMIAMMGKAKENKEQALKDKK